MLIPALMFLLMVTVNSFHLFSEGIPTWQSIRQEWERMLDDAAYPQGFVPGEASVHYPDVGQGNCILIKSGGHAALIDAGETDRGRDVLEYLRLQKVERLDYVIASHPHSDHIGGLAEVLRSLPVDTLILPDTSDAPRGDDGEYDAECYEQLLQAAAETGCRQITAEHGAEYPLGGGTLTVLGGFTFFDDWNNRSLAVRFSYGGTAFLSTGDMEQEAEWALLFSGAELSADVMAAGHHGSKDANTQELLTTVDPEYYVVQSGYANVYRHPAQEALSRMAQQGGQVLRNDVSANIAFATDGQTLSLFLQKNPGEYLR